MKIRVLPQFAPASAVMLVLCAVFIAGCTAPAPLPVEAEVETEVLARTAFTDRIENFFEYDPLRSGETSAFLIHLTDLLDGSPVEDARVELSVRAHGSVNEVTGTTALVGRVTGIYVAEVTAPTPGIYDIGFRVQNDTIDESMTLNGFEVE